MGWIDDPGQVRTRQDLVEYLESLGRRVKEGRVPVENDTAAALILGVSGWISDMDGYFRNQGQEPPDIPDWNLIAVVFTAGLVYE